MENGINEQVMTVLPPSSIDAERSVLGPTRRPPVPTPVGVASCFGQCSAVL